MKKIALILLIFSSFFSFSQNVILTGKVSDEKKNSIPFVNICAIGKNEKICVQSDRDGNYQLKLTENQEYTVIYSMIGYDTVKVKIKTGKGKIFKDIVLKTYAYEISGIEKIAKSVSESGIERLNVKNLQLLPSMGGNAVETLIKTSMGVSSTNELSSQYTVRGGNFDENLVYVNDIQVYRPFLIRSGMQEGMSFINSDLVASIQFSAGGFDARYDDKMSSVLSVTYKVPKTFGGKVSLSLLGGSLSLEDASKNQKFSVIAGLRYRQMSYFFKTFEIKGDYKPIFGDFQTFMTYKFTPKFNISFLGNASQNLYFFIPKSKSQAVGTFNQPMQLSVIYNGQEKDSYRTAFGAVTFNFRPKQDIFLKWIISSFLTDEAERFDIEAYYSLNLIDKQLNSETFGDSILNLGTGGYLTHARNYLNAKVFSFQHKGIANWKGNKIFWGVKAQNEVISDRLREWEYMDSAGYSTNILQRYSQDVIYLNDFVSAENYMNTWRFSSYLQNTKKIYLLSGNLKITAGLRFSYWTYNKEKLLSPRFAALYEPDWENDWYFRFSTGVYYQSPFYRELRKFNGELVKNPKSQRALHFVFGAYYTFRMWDRPFKFSSELYFKKMDNLIPYEFDNLRIRYYADQKAKGYAAGLDMKLYGEFVPGTDSWFSLSLLKTAEDIIGDYYYIYLDKNGDTTYNRLEIADSIRVEPGYIPRPTDRRVNVSIFFQDYLPGNENFKVSLAFFFSTPWPFGPPKTARYRATLRSYPPYMRADLGFSYLLYNKQDKKILKTLWLTLEIFNLLDIRNTASYSWLRVVPNETNPFPVEYQMIAVRNTLTGRLFDLKLVWKF